MELLTNIFSAFGLSASAGLNAYIPLLVIALVARYTELIKLASPWDTLTNPWVIGLLLVLWVIEFFSDKAPAVNHINDMIQTIVRPVAGAIVFAASAGVITESNPVLALVAGLIVAGGVHTVKAAAIRPAVTATTGGVANTPVSIAEDLISTFLSVMAVVLPALFAVLAILLITWFIWFLWKRGTGIRSKNQVF
jgi:hypothetical protein